MQKDSIAQGASRDGLRSVNAEISNRHTGVVSGKPKLSCRSDLQGISKATTRASTTITAATGWTRKMWFGVQIRWVSY